MHLSQLSQVGVTLDRGQHHSGDNGHCYTNRLEMISDTSNIMNTNQTTWTLTNVEYCENFKSNS